MRPGLKREMIQHKVPLPNNFRNFIISLENICPKFLERNGGRKGSERFDSEIIESAMNKSPNSTVTNLSSIIPMSLVH